MAPRIGLVGGTGLYGLPKTEPIEVETDYGNVVLQRLRLGGREAFFLPRHGPRHEWTPLRINHHANVAALAAARCDYVIAVNNVGSLRRDLKPGGFAVLADFLDDHRLNRPTFFPDAAVHTDFSEPYCPTVGAALLKVLPEPREVVYAGTDGPRFETRAETRDLAARGADVVGMTGVPEAVLAHEKGLCYGGLAFIGNHATGLTRGRLRATHVQAGLRQRRRQLLAILEAGIRRLPPSKTCRCAQGVHHAALSWKEGRR